MSDEAQVSRSFYAALVASIAVYGVAATSPLFTTRTASKLVLTVEIIVPALFALLHGFQVYRLRGVLLFISNSFLVGGVFEVLGVASGFPFGNYYFTEAMGPKLLGVPLLMGLAYFALGYTSWTLALLILNKARQPLTGPWTVGAPFLAACIMVAWDLSAEPRWSTIDHLWTWRTGGPYFGVPISNFGGWFLTNYVIFQLFAWFAAKSLRLPRVLPRSYWRIAVIASAVVVLSGITKSLSILPLGYVFDPTGHSWPAKNIAAASILISFLLLGGFVLAAWIRLSNQKADTYAMPAKSATVEAEVR